MKTYLVEACETIDAALFSGDEFNEAPARVVLQGRLERWGRRLKELEPAPAFATVPWAEVERGGDYTYHVNILRAKFGGEGMQLTDEVADFCGAQDWCLGGGFSAIYGPSFTSDQHQTHFREWSHQDHDRFRWDCGAYQDTATNQTFDSNVAFTQARWRFLFKFLNAKLAPQPVVAAQDVGQAEAGDGAPAPEQPGPPADPAAADEVFA